MQVYQQHVDIRARARHAQSNAGGLSAKLGSAGSELRSLSSQLFFPLDVSMSVAARVATKRAKRKAVHHVPWTERALLTQVMQTGKP